MRTAVIGSGVSGLVAAYLLEDDHEITVFEADHRIGGHVHTVPVAAEDGTHQVDTGFIVFNERNYPLFCRLMDRLGVASRESEMSFGVHDERTRLEYCGTSLNTLFAQRRNLLSPGFVGMIREILRFHEEAHELVDGDGAEMPLGEWLDRKGFGRRFREHYLLPMGGAIWSASSGSMLEFPARYFARFLHNHGMLTVDDRPTWRTVTGGSMRYVEAMIRGFRHRIRTRTPVTSVRRAEDGVEITPCGQEPERFDQVIIATHSDQALRMLADPSDAEREILGAIPYRANETVLHTDRNLLPRAPLARAAWNAWLPREERDQVTVTYDMNRLQGLQARDTYLVTLNQTGQIDRDRRIDTFEYAHPQYTPAGVAAQARRDEISGVRRTWYCGAYWGFGFHEDGVRSGVDVARALGRDL